MGQAGRQELVGPDASITSPGCVSIRRYKQVETATSLRIPERGSEGATGLIGGCLQAVCFGGIIHDPGQAQKGIVPEGGQFNGLADSRGDTLSIDTCVHPGHGFAWNPRDHESVVINPDAEISSITVVFDDRPGCVDQHGEAGMGSGAACMPDRQGQCVDEPEACIGGVVIGLILSIIEPIGNDPISDP